MKETVDKLEVSYEFGPGVAVTHALGPGLLETDAQYDVRKGGYRKITTIRVTSPWYRHDGTEQK